MGRHVSLKCEIEDAELTGEDASDPKLIVDAEGRIVAVLLGRPEDDDWDKIIEDMERILAGLRRRGIKRGVFTRKKLDHRRGKFPTLYDGYSHGGGQRVSLVVERRKRSLTNGYQKPGNLRHSRGYRKLLRHLLQSKSGVRLAGFQSSKCRGAAFCSNLTMLQVEWRIIFQKCMATTR
jgi:hypothetical protein